MGVSLNLSRYFKNDFKEEHSSFSEEVVNKVKVNHLYFILNF